MPIDILGDGPDRENTIAARRIIATSGFWDFRPSAAEYYAASDLLIHTCPTEPFGMVILEAMAARIPVLVPDEGGAASLIDDGRTGFKFKADDPQRSGPENRGIARHRSDAV